MTFFQRAACAVILVSCPGWVRGGELPESFTLGRYIPGDVWLYVHEAYNPERDFISAHWDRVWRAALDSGIDADIKNLIISGTADSNRASFEAKWDAARNALSAVPWDRLGRVEVAVAQRIAFPMPGYLVLLRNEPSDTEAIRRSLGGLVETIASVSNACVVLERERHGAKVWSLCLGKVGSMFEVFARGDVVGAAIGKGLTDEVLKLMAGTGAKGAIADDPAFRRAIKSIESPEDGFQYYRWSLFHHQIRESMRHALRRAEEDPDVQMVKGVFTKALAHTDVFDYTLCVRRTEGMQEVKTGVTKVLADAAGTPLVRALTQRKPFDRFDRFIPADANGFWESTTVDLGLLYNTALEFIKQEVPGDGPELIARWDALQDTFGFNLNRDLFSWLSGEMVTVNLPGRAGSQMNFVVMVRTKNPELAWKKVSGWLDALHRRFGQVMVNPAPAVNAEGFRSVFHPMMMMMQVQPVIGMYEDWLMIGTRAKDVNRCLAAARETEPGIRENARFQREGLPARGPVTGAAFTDLSSQGEELALVFGMLGGAAASFPATDDMRQIKTAMTLVSRLAPVMAKIDFQSSSASVSRFTGDAWHSRVLLTYKPFKDAPPRSER